MQSYPLAVYVHLCLLVGLSIGPLPRMLPVLHRSQALGYSACWASTQQNKTPKPCERQTVQASVHCTQDTDPTQHLLLLSTPLVKGRKWILGARG